MVSTIAHYPTYVTFFSTAEKLSLGGLPFVIATEKPTRRDGLAYYRAVVQHFEIPLRQYERVTSIERDGDGFVVHSRVARARRRSAREARAVVVATGYFGSPNYLRVPGEDLPHVTHVYREGHEAFDQDVVVVGGGNSAAEAALDLWRSGARVTLVHFGPTFDKKIKPWVLPDFRESREGREHRRAVGQPRAVRSSRARSSITSPRRRGAAASRSRLRHDRLRAEHGSAASTSACRSTRSTGIPSHDPETLETSVPGVFIAGVVVAGFDANKVFIENGRYHGDKIVARLRGTGAPPEPKLSAELDT